MGPAMSSDPTHDHEMMVETIIDARGNPVPCWPPKEPKWKAKQAIHRLRLNGAQAAVLWSLIDHANSKSGLSYPS